MRSEILYDVRWVDPRGAREVLGLGRVARELIARLPPLTPLEGGPPLLHPLETAWLTTAVARHRPKVFYSPGYNAPPTLTVPFVFTVYDLIHLHVPEESSRRKRLYYRYHVKPAIRRARAIFTGSEFSKGEIVNWSGVDPDRVVVIGAAAASRFTPRGPRYEPGFPYLLYVGNHKPHKNLELLLEAFARASTARAARLLVTGTPSNALCAHVLDLRLAESVVFLGTVPDDRLADLYRGAVAVTVPSLYEGFGLPTLEAMACGTPVVSSTATALAEVVGDAALVVDPRDVDSIADALNLVVDDEATRCVLRAKGLEQAARFSWDRAAKLARDVLTGESERAG